MCGICGCADDEFDFIDEAALETTQTSGLANHNHHHHHEAVGELVMIEQNLLAKNNQFAEANQQFFKKNGITALNMMSSPGSGKTTLLAKTLLDLQHQHEMAVVVGDQQTDYDAQILRATGVQAIQINTGKVCHLDAHMVGHSLEQLTLNSRSLLFIENVGNLVCPALFDLGELYKIVILSVTEGDNKPLKYPEMFRFADLMIITKVDLLPYVTFNIAQCQEYAKRINPSVDCLALSAKTGDGMSSWYEWLARANGESEIKA